MSVFKDLANKIETIDINSIIEKIMSYDFVKEFIINTVQSRWENSGIDAFGEKVKTDSVKGTKKTKNKKFGGGFSRFKAYAGLTEDLKRAGLTIKNGVKVQSKQGVRPYKHVTLNQEGDFYNSWGVLVKKVYIDLTAQFEKQDGNIYDNFETSYSNLSRFKEAVLKMNEKEFEIFVDKIILPEFLAIINYEIQNSQKH